MRGNYQRISRISYYIVLHNTLPAILNILFLYMYKVAHISFLPRYFHKQFLLVVLLLI